MEASATRLWVSARFCKSSDRRSGVTLSDVVEAILLLERIDDARKMTRGCGIVASFGHPWCIRLIHVISAACGSGRLTDTFLCALTINHAETSRLHRMDLRW